MACFHFSNENPISHSTAVFFEELRRLGDIEGQNLIVERYSGEGRPEGLADLAREVVNPKPDLIVVSDDAIAQAGRRGRRHNTNGLDHGRRSRFINRPNTSSLSI
jgi:hypothetical protein